MGFDGNLGDRVSETDTVYFELRMRRGELFGLKWEDLDFQKKTIRIVRSLVDQIEGKPKTEASRKPLPMSDDLDTALQN